MIVENLDSALDWTAPISDMHSTYTNEISVFGKKYIVIKPKNIFLVSIGTMNEISRLILEKEPSNFFLPFQELKTLSGKTEEEIEQVLTTKGTKDMQHGQPGYTVWSHHWLIEYLKVNYNKVIESREPLIFISPEAIANRFDFVEDYFHKIIRIGVDLGQLNDRVVRTVVWHEMAHVCFERPGKLSEPRLSEGLANFCVFASMDDLGKQVLHILACSPELDYRRNYYHLMRTYGGAIDNIIACYLSGDRGRAFEVFGQLTRATEALNAIENEGGAFRFGGSISDDAWIGYGSNKKSYVFSSMNPHFMSNEIST